MKTKQSLSQRLQAALRNQRFQVLSFFSCGLTGYMRMTIVHRKGKKKGQIETITSLPPVRKGKSKLRMFTKNRFPSL